MQEKRIFGYLVTASLPKNTLQAETTFSQFELVCYLRKPVHTKKMYNAVILLQIVESRDSSCKKSWVPVHNQWVLVQKKQEVLTPDS